MILTPTRISTSRLSYDAATGIFAAEASDLPDPSRVYDDACDVGYTLVSHRTGTEIVFAHVDTVKDREGDIMYFVFKPADFRLHASLRDSLVLHIFND